MSFHKDLSESVATEYEQRIRQHAQTHLDIETKKEMDEKGFVEPGFCDNPWTKLLNLWTNNRISNMVVSHALRLSVVPTFICEMDYQSTLSQEPKAA